MNVVYRVEEDIRRSGAFLRLHSLLRKELANLLPDDAHDRINKRSGKVVIAYTRVWPGIRGRFVHHFFSREDLTQCLTASCNIPFYFSKWPTVTCRGTQAVDGYFASSSTFGCPPTSALRDIYISPFSAKTVRLKAPVRNCISPDLQVYDSLLDNISSGSFSFQLRNYLNEYPIVIPQRNESISNESVVSIDNSTAQMAVSQIASFWNISNDRADDLASNVTSIDFNIPVLKYSVNKLLMIALTATKDEHLAELFDLGRSDAFRWMKLEEFTRNILPDTPMTENMYRLKQTYLHKK